MPYWILAAAVVLGPVEVRYESLDGELATTQLHELGATQAVFEQEGTDHLEQSLDQLARIESTVARDTSESTPAVWIELIDGSTLQANRYSIVDSVATFELLDGETLELDADLLRAIRLRPLAEALTEQWQAIYSRQAIGDTLVLIRSEESLDYLEGLLEEFSNEAIQFHFDGTTHEVNHDRVEGVVYYHPTLPELSAPICKVRDHRGNQWQAASIRFDGQSFHGTCVAGAEFTLAADQWWEIDYSQGNVIYLTELEPESLQWRPFIDGPSTELLRQMWGTPGKNETIDGRPLSLYTGEGNQQREFSRGLSIHSHAEIVYRLPEGFHRLQAVVGIDASARPNGHVELSIVGDDTVLLNQVISGSLSRDSQENSPLLVDLDITGISRLEIVVACGEDQDMGDHLNLCDVRIVR